jgi:Flp pilus assembly protein TadB
MPEPHTGVLKTIAIALAIVGTIGGWILAQEVRYAKAADLAAHAEQDRQQARAFNTDILESRRQALRARIFEMEQARKSRPGGLSVEEERYLDEQRQLYLDTTEKIKRINP